MSEFKVNTITNRDGSHGPQVCGITTFGSSGLQLPSGPTEFRGGRGRGIVAGGQNPSPTPYTAFNVINLVEIATTGNATDFGDLITARQQLTGGVASATRAVFAGGEPPGNPSTNVSTIGYVTISSGGGENDFGDLNEPKRRFGSGASNNIRGIIPGGGGDDGRGTISDIQFITIATTGDTSIFGNLTVPADTINSVSSPTRGVFGGLRAPSFTNTIEFITIQSFGDSQDFGDLSVIRRACGSSSNQTRGLFCGGDTPTKVDTIDYITIATEGNATDFGNLTAARSFTSATASATRLIIAGGAEAPARVNKIEFVTISTLGNSVDFGDLIQAVTAPAGSSDVHGGLAQ